MRAAAGGVKGERAVGVCVRREVGRRRENAGRSPSVRRSGHSSVFAREREKTRRACGTEARHRRTFTHLAESTRARPTMQAPAALTARAGRAHARPAGVFAAPASRARAPAAAFPRRGELPRFFCMRRERHKEATYVFAPRVCPLPPRGRLPGVAYAPRMPSAADDAASFFLSPSSTRLPTHTPRTRRLLRPAPVAGGTQPAPAGE